MWWLLVGLGLGVAIVVSRRWRPRTPQWIRMLACAALGTICTAVCFLNVASIARDPTYPTVGRAVFIGVGILGLVHIAYCLHLARREYRNRA